MSEADRARQAALSLEVKKDGLTQLQSGNWKLTLTVSPTDMPEGILSAPMGTRYMAALVEVDDTEQPVDRSEDDTPGKRAKKHFEAACHGEEFQHYMRLRMESAELFGPDDTRAAAKQTMGIKSATEIIAYPEKWKKLYNEFKYRNFQ